jgi:outer membrane protein OmpA-like peptidoglycan-associated protein
MKQVHLLDRNGLRQWIVVNTFADSSRLLLTVVTLGDAPKILSATELKKQIDSQGFATLNLNFDTNKAELRDADRPTLEQVVQLLRSNPDLRLSVEGHTDNVGQAADNKRLSQQRAQAIVDHLVAGGTARDRLLAKGHGMEVPVGDNRSEEGRAKNRRVELVKLPAGGAAATTPPAAPAVVPAAPAAQKAAVQVVSPEALLDFLKQHPKVVVLFTSPSFKCGFCVGADKTFEEVAALLGGGDWRYVRTEWSPCPSPWTQACWAFPTTRFSGRTGRPPM